MYITCLTYYVCICILVLEILSIGYQMLYWLCDLGHTMDDREVQLMDGYISMQSLPPHCGVVVYNLWLLDNRNYQVSEAWSCFLF